MNSVIEVKNLSIKNDNGNILNNVSFKINQGEILCLLGQSGSGKTMTANALLNMLPSSVRKTNGEILYNNSPFNNDIRGKFISTIMQSPASCFDNVFTIRTQFKDILTSNNKEYNEELVCSMLNKMDFHNPQSVLNAYAFQLSGGMLQKIMIAVSLLLESKVIVADEPTSDLDVYGQREILNYILKVRDNNRAVFLITHNTAVAKYIADRVIVMNQGSIVDEFQIDHMEDSNRHKYTKELLAANSILYSNSWNIKIGESYADM